MNRPKSSSGAPGGEPAGGIHDLGPPPVIHRDEQPHALVPCRAGLGLVDLGAQVVAQLVEATDEPDGHPLRVEVGDLAVDELREEHHQVLDLVLRAAPVLSG
ncbi:MAG: hypothetical protein O3B97_01775, partial [Actinomycetota bacterium]|nr:hypothetical protein [Actinomycetota bacterium]